MSLDTADFPLVWMRQKGRDTQAELAEFSALLARAEPFVLMTDRSVGAEAVGERYDHAGTERRQTRGGGSIRRIRRQVLGLSDTGGRR